MASEDPDQLLPGCLPIHRFRDLRDFNETSDIKMSSVRNHSHATRELLEVALLRSPKRVSVEERNNRSQELLSAVYDELAQVLAMIVVPLRDIDATHAKEAP